jgi:hypothetical protein
MAFTEDSLLKQGGGISYHGDHPLTDQDLTPTLENIVVLTWLRLLHPGLPNLVKQRYGTELRSRTLASVKPEISQALEPLMDELRSSEDAKVLRAVATTYKFKRNSPQMASYSHSGKTSTHSFRSCPLCVEAGRVHQHFLSTCKYLPEADRRFFAKTRLIIGIDNEEAPNSDNDCCDLEVADHISMRCVNVKQSPYFKAFHGHHSLRVITPLSILGEINIVLSRNGRELGLDALVVEDLDVDILAGTPFMVTNDISVRPAKAQIMISNAEVIHYGSHRHATDYHAVRRAQSQVLRAPSTQTTIWPGEYVELDVEDKFDPETVIAIEPRVDLPLKECSQSKQLWPAPDIIDIVGGKICLMNTRSNPLTLRKNEHFCQATYVAAVQESSESDSPNGMTGSTIPTQSISANVQYSSLVQLDPDEMLTPEQKDKFSRVLIKHDIVFSPDIPGYNGSAGKFEFVVNMGSVQPPQRKGRMPQYSWDKLTELQDKFNDLESLGVFRRPEEAGVVVE